MPGMKMKSAEKGVGLLLWGPSSNSAMMVNISVLDLTPNRAFRWQDKVTLGAESKEGAIRIKMQQDVKNYGLARW